METQIDEGRGQKVGSRIRLSGRVFGVELSVEEIVVERDPPRRKVWETTGAPKLLVVGHYRMGFELSARGNASMLRVFIEYALPEIAPRPMDIHRPPSGLQAGWPSPATKPLSGLCARAQPPVGVRNTWGGPAFVSHAPARWLGRLFGRYYARWCTRQMVDDAVEHFQTRPGAQLST